MATPSDVKFEIQQADYSWLDCYGDLQSLITANKIGLNIDPSSVSSLPDAGKFTAALVNTSGNYTPAANGIGSGRIDNNRRVRIRYSGKNNGKALQAIVNGIGGAGGTVDTAAGTGTLHQVGNTPRHQISQSFKATLPGVWTSFILNVQSNNPITSALWELHNYDVTQTGNIGTTLLASGNVNNASTGLQTTTVTAGPYLVVNTTYILVLKWPVGNTQGANFWGSSSDTYANGTQQVSVDDGVTWTDTLADLNLKIVTSGDAVYTSQTVTTAVAISDVWTLQWDARAQFDSQYNIDAVNIVTSGETGAQTIYTYTNKWVTYTLTFTATANGTTIAPRFAPQLPGNGNNSQSLEYRNITLKKGAGANVLTNGDFSSGATSPWTVTNAGSTTLTDTVINDYMIRFNGYIEDIHPDAQLSNVSPLVTLDLVDNVQQVKDQLTTLPLQKLFTSDSLTKLALAKLPSGTLHTTLPGTAIDVGHSTFPVGGDTWVNNRTSILQIINQGVLSELGRCWFDLDGTFIQHNRDYVALRSGVTPKLSLADGQDGYKLVLKRAKAKIRNDIVITSHQRVTSAAAGTIGKMDQASVFIPGNGSISITLTFKDSAGNTIGADSLVPLAATTDYLVNYYAINDSNYVPGANDQTTSQYLTVTSTNTASQMVVTFKSSSSAFAGWVNFLQVRGLTVTQYNPATVEVSAATSIAKYGTPPFTLDLPFLVDQALITSYANYLLSSFKYPFIEANYFECKNTTIVNGVDVMSLEIGDPISVSDTQNGLSSVIHMVTNIEFDWGTERGNSEPDRVKVYLERMDQVKYWELGVAGFSELGQTTVLYI